VVKRPNIPVSGILAPCLCGRCRRPGVCAGFIADQAFFRDKQRRKELEMLLIK
jgi:hypothetical protein